jgi:type IV pilus assembly protein PilW
MKADHGAGAPTFTAVGPTEQLMVLRKGMVVLATDCNVARIFAISNDIDAVGKTEVDVSHNISVSNGPDNVSTGLSIIFPSGSQILFMSRMTYFIGPSQLIPGQNSLYRHSTIEGAVAQELVPYVENMQLTYGVDTNNDTIADTYKTAAQIATDGEDMTADVYSINVDLQVATNVDNSLSRALVGDGVFRKRYTQLISIRNAGFGQY